MVFEQTGIGTNAAFAQSLIIGLVSLVFTALAILLIDKVGRRPLVNIGLAASIMFLLLCVYAFSQATYQIDAAALASLISAHPELSILSDSNIVNTIYDNDVSFKQAARALLSNDLWSTTESALFTAAININANLVLIGIVGFIAAFHLSIGPIMWVVFSEIVPTQIRSIAIPSFAFVCSLVSFFMQKYFPLFLNNAGATMVFLSYAVSGLVGLILLYKLLPETKGKSIEEIERILVK